jgi:hypothetical protein
MRRDTPLFCIPNAAVSRVQAAGMNREELSGFMKESFISVSGA